MSRYIVPDVLLKNKVSTLDVTDKILKKGHPEDAMAALRVLALATMQLGELIISFSTSN